MKLIKLALVAAMALAGITAQAADGKAISAKLQSVSAKQSTAAIPAPPLADPNKQDLRAWFASLTPSQKKQVVSSFKDLTPQQQKYLIGVWKDLPTSAG